MRSFFYALLSMSYFPPVLARGAVFLGFVEDAVFFSGSRIFLLPVFSPFVFLGGVFLVCFLSSFFFLFLG